MSLDRLGLIKTTLLDFPGRVAAVLFTHGCDLRCPWCHNPGLVVGQPPEDFLPREEIFRFLIQRKPILEGVAITGGEPLYHQDLPELLTSIRQLGYEIKLDTNGTYPDRLGALPKGLVSMVAMDLKCAPERYYLQGIPGMGDKIIATIRLIQNRYPHHQFRTTWVPGLNSFDEIPIMADLLGNGEKLVLTGFRPGTTLSPEWRIKRAPTPEELSTVGDCFATYGIDVTIT